MDPNLRERRRREAAREGRRRAQVATVLAILAHLIGLPLFALVFSFRQLPAIPKKDDVAFVEVPAAAWDATMEGARKAARRDPAKEKRPAPERAPAEEKEKEPPRHAPGQVVETAPGNEKEDPDAKLAAETSNQVERETIARDRAPGAKVTMPRPTTDRQAPEEASPPRPAERAGDGLAIGAPGRQGEKKESAGTKLEVPDVQKQEKIALQPGAEPGEGIPNREGSEALRGNSDRFRLQVGAGEGDADAGGAGGEAGQGGKPLRLFPSQAELAAIAGGPAPDHVEGVAEGEGTFLNTREWKYASFFNRVKRNVSETWDPITELRKRDPSGQIYAFKDRHTLLSVTLSADGTIRDVWVEKSSGVDFLDQEAVAAFLRAQPFPNPPRGLFDENGAVQFHFGFYLEFGRSSFRLFR